MSKIIGFFITIIFSITIFLVAKDIIYDINIIEEVRISEESYIASNYLHQIEDLVVDYDVIDVLTLNVDTYDRSPVDNYVIEISGNEITLKANTSDINDVIIISYTYWYIGDNEDVSDNLENLINIIPIMILITIISSLVYTKWKKTKV